MPYEDFIVPGLITMAMIQAAYANNSASVFQARFDRYINDVLAAPMRAWEVNLGLSLGGVVRALCIGVRCSRSRRPVIGVPVREPLVLVARAGARARRCSRRSASSSGIYAAHVGPHAFVKNIVILPLTFLGGVFYSVDVAALAVAGDLAT